MVGEDIEFAIEHVEAKLAEMDEYVKNASGLSDEDKNGVKTLKEQICARMQVVKNRLTALQEDE